ncbi:MAG: class I SAM-dependent methyltransferase [Nitrospira sp.]|nr:class I SAM-dependent methyltransferase [Nitrospira sp.]
MTTSNGIAEMDSVKARLRTIWMAGDYDRFSRYLESGAREFYERLPVAPGATLLDVGCGSGQLALIAAKDGLAVTGVDIAPNWVERARARAQAEGLRATFDEGDAEALPYADKSFDLVVSVLGAMFAPQPDLVAQELLRVCVPGGTVAMANWTPQGFVGQMFKTVSKFIAPSGMPSPVLWGDETTVRARLGRGLSDLRLVRRDYPLNYPFPPAEVVDLFRLYYGPINRAFASLDAEGGAQLHRDLEALWTVHNRAGTGCTIIRAEYLEIIGTRT